MSESYGWAGALHSLVESDPISILALLQRFVPDASSEQLEAWRASVCVLQQQGARVLQLRPSASEHGALLEYELPREGGRRPDVVLLQNGRVVVLEFKSAERPRRSDIDQVSAYARDLRGYHSACAGLEVLPAVVVPSRIPTLTLDGVSVVGAEALADWLVALGGDGPVIRLQDFVNGEYAPLPSLVAAARMLFENLPLPFIRRAQSAGVAESVELILRWVQLARERRERHLVLLTGVPGAGKTLVGLQVAHSARLQGDALSRGSPATFLSGNGPLVQVLQHALKSTTFVRDMHGFIREHGLKHPGRVPAERVIIFDEAQRAWDAPKIQDFYSTRLDGRTIDLNRSEPQLLVEIASRMNDGCLVLGLVGTGQEIHVGEEGGLKQWADAIAGRGWLVHGPPALADVFEDERYEVHPRLTLDTTLRAHAAAELHQWVAQVMAGGSPPPAAAIAARLRSAGFPIYVVRDLEAARRYARQRFSGEPLRRFGQLASSRADRFLLDFGIDCGFQATKRLKVGPWFNAPPSDPLSCCQLTTTATEFQSQGLELDLPIVCWGDDLRIESGAWRLRPRMRPSPLVRDPHQLRTNAYRVLLTRGREGLVLFVPPAKVLDATYEYLRAAGALAPSTTAGQLATG